ncbi:uncharacterized protein LOC141532706 [Cotesia typhae]|uniref:uncharacterized protein LOC141532706 n=1 Tax=Cotesia typhae TaxID=2053667 RepID=UPI003D6976D7
MRRTRFTVLPVRSWQYVGLMVVSLACMTLGLVSRDRAGRSGSLAGPELKHTAPHEVDACPNELAMIFRSLGDDPAAKGLEFDHRIDPYKLDQSRISRSRSLDRVDARRLARREIDARLESRRLSRNLRESQRLNRDRQLENRARIDVRSRQNRGEIRASVRDRRIEETRVQDLRNRDVSRDRRVDSRAVERRLAQVSRVRESRDERRVASRSSETRDRRSAEASRVRESRDERRLASRSLDSRERRIGEASRARESTRRLDQARESTRRLEQARESRNERRMASRLQDSRERRIVEAFRARESRDERRVTSRSLDSRERRVVEASRVRDERRVSEIRGRDARDQRFSATRAESLGKREAESSQARETRDERRIRDNNTQHASLVSRIRRESISREWLTADRKADTIRVSGDQIRLNYLKLPEISDKSDFEFIKQALVAGLFTIYAASIFQGKASNFRSIIPQARLAAW